MKNIGEGRGQEKGLEKAVREIYETREREDKVLGQEITALRRE